MADEVRYVRPKNFRTPIKPLRSLARRPVAVLTHLAGPKVCFECCSLENDFGLTRWAVGEGVDFGCQLASSLT